MFGQPKGFFALAALPIDVLYNDGKIGESTCCPPHFFDDQATIPATQRMVGESLASPDVGNMYGFVESTLSPQGSGHSDGCEVGVRRLTCMFTVEPAWFPAHLLL